MKITTAVRSTRSLRCLLIALLASGAALVPVPSLATVHIVNFTGTSSGLTTNSFVFNGSNFNTGSLTLDSFIPFTVEEGDTIQATLTLVGGFVVPASGEQLFGLNFFRTDGADPVITAGPSETTVSGSGVFSFTGGPTGLPSNAQGGACGNCLTSIMGQIPGNAFTFDGFTLTQTIDRLGAPYEINTASFSYQLRDTIGAVPEPATWAMMIFGFGAVGSAMRQQRRKHLAAA
jgi:hypothetical protein